MLVQDIQTEKINLLRSNQLKIYLLTFISFLVGTSQFVIAGVLDKISDSLNITVSSAGQLITAFALASAIGTPILTLIVSRYSLKKQLLIALFIFIIGAVLTPLSSNFTILIIARIITGIGSILFVVVSYILASKLAKKNEQGSAMSNIALGFSLSLVAGVPLGRAISNLYNWQMIFYFIAFLVFICIFMITFSIKDEKSTIKNSFMEQLKLLKNKKVLLSLMITFFVFISFSSITTYITPLLLSIPDINENNLTTIFLILGIASVIGSKSGATIADKVGISKILISTLFTIIVTLILMYIFKDFYIFVLMLTIWTISTWMFGPTQSLNLSILFPNHASILLSLNSSVVQLGFAFGAIFSGISIDRFSINSIILLSVISTLIALFLYKKLQLEK